jgi:peptide/nickel transport system permease protein
MGEFRRKLRRFLRHKGAMAGLILTVLMLGLAVAGPLLVHTDPLKLDPLQSLRAPNALHPFGTDDVGRDVLSRVVYGARLSLAIGFVTTVATTLFGTLLGLVSGYFPWLDNPIMRILDGLSAFPAILLAIAIMAALGPNASNVMIALTIVYTPRCARVVRGSVLQIRNLEYIEAARALGIPTWRILWKHILSNSLSPLLVQQTFTFAYAVLAEASLSFVGAGAPPPQPSWGNILADARSVLREGPWLSLFPGCAIALTVLGLNLLGDGLRDILDPRYKS